ncbi:MAG: hypothetical protein M3077_11395, partial [Candidatus Dormibacteraeota bacterium]|nr:hypothetical protein [Candidatus Dormibacteraeota bacterium]
LPTSQWHLFANLEAGYALTLPQTWSAFDLNTDIELAAGKCSVDGPLKDARQQQLTNLHARGVRLFACDTSRAGDARIPIAYGVAGQVPAEGLDKYVDGTKQAAGREVLDRRHTKTNAGDMIVQKVHERLTAQDGSALVRSNTSSSSSVSMRSIFSLWSFRPRFRMRSTTTRS